MYNEGGVPEGEAGSGEVRTCAMSLEPGGTEGVCCGELWTGDVCCGELGTGELWTGGVCSGDL